jgi:hypothetical protein
MVFPVVYWLPYEKHMNKPETLTLAGTAQLKSLLGKSLTQVDFGR